MQRDAGALVEPDGERDFALLGKLHSIAQQIEKDLAQAASIAGKHAGHLGSDFATPAEGLLPRLPGDYRERGGAVFVQAEGVGGEFDFAGFGFGGWEGAGL